MGRGLLGGAEGKSGSRCDEVNRISEGMEMQNRGGNMDFCGSKIERR